MRGDESDPGLGTGPSSQFAVDPSERRAAGSAKWVKHPDTVLPAWVAEHDFRPPAEVVEAFIDVGERAAFGYHYRARDLGDAYVDWARERHDWEVDPRLVRGHVDVLQGVTGALLALTEAGDGLIMPTPVYHPFWDIAPAAGRVQLEWPMGHDESGWYFDVNRLETLVRVEPRAKVLLLCHPHNPTGRVVPADTLAALVDLAATYDFHIVSDEIHGDLVHPGAEFRPILSLPGAADRAVTVTSAAKTFSLSGIRCAISVHGSAELMERIRAAHCWTLLGHPSRGGIEATISAWTHGSSWVDSLAAVLTDNRDHLVARVEAEAPAAIVHPPEATFLSWIDVSACGLGPDPAAELERRAGVAVSEGRIFGPGGEGHIRVNFGTSRRLLDELLDRMLPHLGG